MQTVDENWLFIRGGLHDAFVVSICADTGHLDIRLNDEWANERGLSKPEHEEEPIILRFFSASVRSGEWSHAVGGRVSEIVRIAGGDFSLIFQDRNALLIRAASVAALKLEFGS